MKLNRRRKIYIFCACLLLWVGLLEWASAVDQARWARLTGEAPATLVKREEGCYMCPSSVGYVSEVATYRYVVGGVEYLRSTEYECSSRRCDRPDYSKVCYEPGKPGDAAPAGAGVTCGAN